MSALPSDRTAHQNMIVQRAAVCIPDPASSPEPYSNSQGPSAEEQLAWELQEAMAEARSHQRMAAQHRYTEKPAGRRTDGQKRPSQVKQCSFNHFDDLLMSIRLDTVRHACSQHVIFGCCCKYELWLAQAH